jgi:uncharacterized membrane protein HdeD (DUF308 family)
MKRLIMAIMLVGCICLLSGCADVQHVSGLSGEPAGFWRGLWHGTILPIAFIVRLFSDDTAIYAVNNSGGWYDFGFLLGAGSSRASR